MMIYMLRGGCLPNINIYAKVDRNENFKRIREAKLDYQLKDLCNEQEGTLEMQEFLMEIFNYRFEHNPNYKKLKAILENLKNLYTP